MVIFLRQKNFMSLEGETSHCLSRKSEKNCLGEVTIFSHQILRMFRVSPQPAAVSRDLAPLLSKTKERVSFWAPTARPGPAVGEGPLIFVEQVDFVIISHDYFQLKPWV